MVLVFPGLLIRLILSWFSIFMSSIKGVFDRAISHDFEEKFKI